MPSDLVSFSAPSLNRFSVCFTNALRRRRRRGHARRVRSPDRDCGARAVRSPASDFPAMSFRIVFVSLAIFLVGHLLVGTIAKWLILGKAAHTDPDRLFLRFDFKRLLVGFNDFAHTIKLMRPPWRWQAQQVNDGQQGSFLGLQHQVSDFRFLTYS